MMVYLPTQRPLTVSLSSLRTAQARARWFDPRSGEYFEIGTVPTQEPGTFTPPTWGPDWVLVVDC
jgi:hypothetical protein